MYLSLPSDFSQVRVFYRRKPYLDQLLYTLEKLIIILTIRYYFRSSHCGILSDLFYFVKIITRIISSRNYITTTARAQLLKLTDFDLISDSDFTESAEWVNETNHWQMRVTKKRWTASVSFPLTKIKISVWCLDCDWRAVVTDHRCDIWQMTMTWVWVASIKSTPILCGIKE